MSAMYYAVGFLGGTEICASSLSPQGFFVFFELFPDFDPALTTNLRR